MQILYYFTFTNVIVPSHLCTITFEDVVETPNVKFPLPLLPLNFYVPPAISNK